MDVSEKTGTRAMGLRISLILIAIAITTVEIMQLAWFRQSAAAEIESARHALSSEVVQVFSREFQRYAPLVASLHELASEKGKSAEEARSVVKALWESYGPGAGGKGIISGSGLADLAAPSVMSAPGSGGAWESASSGLPTSLPADALAQLGEGKLVDYFDPQNADRQFILARAGTARLVIVELDMKGFIDDFAVPALDAELPGTRIEWVAEGSASRDGKGSEAQREAWTQGGFNPLKVLFGIGAAGRRTFRSSMPATIDAYLMHSIVPIEADASAEGGAAGYRSPQAGGEHPYASGRRSRPVNIILPPNSAILATELRLSLNWLLGAVFLLGIGLAFSQTLVQKHKLKAVSEREREFVASVTHEFRTPVTAIRTASDNMRKGLVGPERMATYGEMIHAQSIRLGTMVEEMLLLSKVERKNAPPIRPVEVRTAELLGALRPPLDEIAASSGIRLSWDLGSLPERFLGDPESLNVIISNIVANALNHAYSEPGGGEAPVGEPHAASGATREVRVIGRASLPGALQFIVEDDGRGIARAEAKLVFEPFYRDEESRRRQEKGSGLGLFIARRKAEMLGGKLSLESPYRRVDGARRSGCRFKLEVPMEEAGDAR